MIYGEIGKIDRRIEEALERAIDTDTGEIVDEEAMTELEQLQMDRDAKLEGIGLWIKDLKAEAAGIKEEADNLRNRMLAKLMRAESLTNYLAYALQGEKFETPCLAVSFRKSTSVLISDAELLPAELMTVKTEIKPNKKLITDRIKSGEVIPGASLIEKQNIQIK